jgi:hypothetical protein
VSGFPVTAKAIEALDRELEAPAAGRSDREISEAALRAALVALAADPDVRKRVFLAVEQGECGSATGRACSSDEFCRCEATTRAVLAALFGVASPSTKETGKNG